MIDHLNTQKIASLYSAFPPEQANRLAKKLEIHYTPKQGSWLNIAEIELAAMTKQCLSRRIPAPQTLKAEIDAGCRQAHDSERQVDWQFSSAKARIKLKRLYPQNSGRLSTRWVIERTNSWMERCKGLVKNFERTLNHANAKISLCFVRLMLKRLAIA